MIQRFIELGQGYSDIYELIEIATSNRHRVQNILRFNTIIDGVQSTSFTIVLKPTVLGNFQPLYTCREGIIFSEDKISKRIEMIEQLASEMDIEIITFSVKPSKEYAEINLYYQHLIGILRMNKIIPPLQ